jgi:hypothetical protein
MYCLFYGDYYQRGVLQPEDMWLKYAKMGLKEDKTLKLIKFLSTLLECFLLIERKIFYVRRNNKNLNSYIYILYQQQ